MTCPICLEDVKIPIKLDCSHTFCLSCIRKWNQKTNSENSNKCPLCRKNIIDELDTKYNLRRKHNMKNIKELKKFMDEFYNTDLIDEKIVILDKIFKFISNHKFMLCHNSIFKKTTLDKIIYFKNENISQAYYWDNLINSVI